MTGDMLGEERLVELAFEEWRVRHGASGIVLRPHLPALERTARMLGLMRAVDSVFHDIPMPSLGWEVRSGPGSVYAGHHDEFDERNANAFCIFCGRQLTWPRPSLTEDPVDSTGHIVAAIVANDAHARACAVEWYTRLPMPGCFEVTPTEEVTSTGRRRYHVRCTRCSHVLHGTTTAPASVIAEHERLGCERWRATEPLHWD